MAFFFPGLCQYFSFAAVYKKGPAFLQVSIDLFCTDHISFAYYGVYKRIKELHRQSADSRQKDAGIIHLSWQSYEHRDEQG